MILDRVTTSIEQAPGGGYRIRIRYWSKEHRYTREELSTRTFTNAADAERVAIQVAHTVRDRIVNA